MDSTVVRDDNRYGYSFNDTGGYCSISTEESDDGVFFHMDDVGGEDLTEGSEIDFDIE